MRTVTIIVFFSLLWKQFTLAVNADAYLKAPELLSKYGYPSQVHYVTTADGYILKLYRIPHGKNNSTPSRKPVLLLHGIMFSSDCFLLNGVNQSLGYILADEGYDVWLGNVRGNTESRNHTSLNANTNPKFWNFSWHEIGVFDLPAMIDYVLKVTNQQQLFYIGHSQGTTIIYVLLSMRPEYNQKIRAHFDLAPVGFMNHMKSPVLKILAKMNIADVGKFLGLNEMFQKSALAGGGLIPDDINSKLFGLFFYVVMGYKEINNIVFAVMAGHFPAGCSLKQLTHYAQEIKSGYFRQYDYGKMNTKMYGVEKPPSYNLSLVTAPGYLFYGDEDQMTAAVDVDRLYDGLRKGCFGKYVIAGFKHLDFLVGKDATALLNSKILTLMNKDWENNQL